MIYLLEVSACLICFYAFFHFFLSGKNQHHINRYYLLSTLLFSFFLPVLSIPFYEVIIYMDNSTATVVNSFETTDHESNIAFSLLQIVMFIYYAGVITLISKLFIELSNIISIIKKSNTQHKDDFNQVNINDQLPLSSFFNYIFIPKKLTPTKFEIQHELAHVKQLHSADKILVSIANAILWFNPVSFLYKRSLHEVHEYLADEAVVQKFEKAEYQNFLYKSITKTYKLSAINPFYSLIKNRLTMMNNEIKSPKLSLFLIVPLIIFLCSIFSCDKYTTLLEDPNVVVEEIKYQVDTITVYNSTTKEFETRYTRKIDLSTDEEELIISLLDTMSIFDEETQEMIERIVETKLSLEQANELFPNKVNAQNQSSAYYDTIAILDDNGDELVQRVIKNTPVQSSQNEVIDQTKVYNNIPSSSIPFTGFDYTSMQDTILIFDEATFEETTEIYNYYISLETADLLSENKINSMDVITIISGSEFSKENFIWHFDKNSNWWKIYNK